MNNIKISILKDGDNFAYIEFQSGNDPKVYNNTYGTTGYLFFEDVCKDIVESYQGEEIQIFINIKQKETN